MNATGGSSDQASGRTLIAVVLYRTVPQESETVRGVVSALRSSADLRAAYELLLWDNTPEALAAPPRLDVPCQYQHATTNNGVAGAFNGAMDVCINNGYQWMLMLDQDTEVTSEYLMGMLHHRDTIGADSRIAAIAPLLFHGDFQLSPQQVLRFRHAPVTPKPARILGGEAFAANSGVLIRVAALSAIGGYSVDFWLDHSDMYVFHQLHLQGKAIYLATDLHLQHSMTMLDYDGQMTPERYDNFLHAEQAFLDLYKSFSENAASARLSQPDLFADDVEISAAQTSVVEGEAIGGMEAARDRTPNRSQCAGGRLGANLL
jgi:hypothetical protein